MRRNKFKILIAVLLLATIACKEEHHVPPTWGQSLEDVKEPNPEIVKLGWKNMEAEFGELPTYIDVYKSPSTLINKSVVAYVAVADMRKGKWDILGDVEYDEQANGYGAKTVHTLGEFYTKSPSKVIINGGLFYYANQFYYSQNLVYKNGIMLSTNQNYYSKDWVKYWYPTMGAFAQQGDNSFKVNWTYYNSTAKVNYAYNVPSNNDINKDPLKVPDATFPETAMVYNPKTAIGGIIVLLKNGEIKNTITQEMFDVSATSNQPRTAIGVTNSNKLVLFVCEGRNVTPGVAGLTTADLAQVMKDLGCIDALNLDGGGSSGMLVNGKETIKPSGGNQRAVLTAVSLN